MLRRVSASAKSGQSLRYLYTQNLVADEMANTNNIIKMVTSSMSTSH